MKKIASLIAISILSSVSIGGSLAADVQKKKQETLEAQTKLKDARQKESEDRAHKANESMQQVSRASRIIGTDIKNSKGENLGDIKELVLDPESGRVVYAVVSFGGVLGIGDKLFAVPWRVLKWVKNKEYYLLNVEKSTLKKAPGFDKKHWPESSSQWDHQREVLDQFYRVEP
ncbi:PRC-barrel domain-containing protein [Methylotetracoccus oryzae]|uniref:PRC-barrel domain-containing protein n=1 Tax=Methylotetracoccus oryzae TaxID=1919059 RepID=UPI00111B5005|nr:PRC-barrel domain-containing protein [Methylotetracoccus oryzae]